MGKIKNGNGKTTVGIVHYLHCMALIVFLKKLLRLAADWGVRCGEKA